MRRRRGDGPKIRAGYRRSQPVRQVLDTAAESGHAPSVFFGRRRRSVTTHHYDDTGRLIRSETIHDAEWTPWDRQVVFARRAELDLVCPDCGQPRDESMADENLGPVAAAKVPLTAGRSLAVDRLLHSFHAPVWVETALPDGSPLRRLLIAQDTGSAIVGPARGDIFFGSGDAAGAIAGAMRAAGRFVLLMPRGAP